MLTSDEIKASGYTEYPVSYVGRIKGTNRFWQKCFYNQYGKKEYFINVEQWDWRDRPNHPSFSYEASAQLTTSDNEVFNIELLYPKSIQQVELFFEKCFVKLQCKNYDD